MSFTPAYSRRSENIVVIDGEYIWKYTHNAYDFSVLGTTPITFPIEWNNSKIPGFARSRERYQLSTGFTALVVMSSVAARFFTPQIGGVGAVPVARRKRSVRSGLTTTRHFNETTHLQYQPWKRGPWLGFNWRYDSGLVRRSCSLRWRQLCRQCAEIDAGIRGCPLVCSSRSAI